MPAFSTKTAVIKACTRVHPSLTEGGDDLENLAASSSLQAWFDTETLEARENGNLDVVVTTEQHSIVPITYSDRAVRRDPTQLRIHHEC